MGVVVGVTEVRGEGVRGLVRGDEVAGEKAEVVGEVGAGVRVGVGVVIGVRVGFIIGVVFVMGLAEAGVNGGAVVLV